MMLAKRSGPFGPGLLRFLRELEKNNSRAWFERNKQRYEDEVREPALHFIRQMAPHVERISPHLLETASSPLATGPRFEETQRLGTAAGARVFTGRSFSAA